LGGAGEDVRLSPREGEHMRFEHVDGLRRIAEEKAFRRFAEAVLALSENPGPRNVEQYLVASRALEPSRSSREPRLSRAA
jgi:hypothetical protein